MAKTFVCVVCCVLLAHRATLNGEEYASEEDSASLMAELKQSGPSAWRQFRQATFNTIQATVKSTAELNSDTRHDVYRDETRLYQRGNCRMAWMLDLVQNAETVYCTNNKYRFKVTKNVGSDDWILQEVKLVESKDELHFDPDLNTGSMELRSILQRAFAANFINVISEPIEEIVLDPSFQITQAKRADEEILDLSIEFVLRDNYTVTGLLRISPAPHWRLTGYELLVSDRGSGRNIATYTMVAEYEQDKAGFFRPKRRHERVENATDHGFRESELVFDYHSIEDLAKSDFRLTAFGLPEPEGIRWRLPLSVWLAAVAVLLLAVGVFVKWRKSR